MDLKELKRIVAYARRAGLKSLKLNGVEIEFNDHAVSPKKLTPLSLEDIKPKHIENDITLEDINAYIYGDEIESMNEVNHN